jgi:hypothetical protein
LADEQSVTDIDRHICGYGFKSIALIDQNLALKSLDQRKWGSRMGNGWQQNASPKNQ